MYNYMPLMTSIKAEFDDKASGISRLHPIVTVHRQMLHRIGPAQLLPELLPSFMSIYFRIASYAEQAKMRLIKQKLSTSNSWKIALKCSMTSIHTVLHSMLCVNGWSLISILLHSK